MRSIRPFCFIDASMRSHWRSVTPNDSDNSRADRSWTKLFAFAHRKYLLFVRIRYGQDDGVHGVMLKFAIKREQRQACLDYAEREQIEQKLTCFSISPRAFSCSSPRTDPETSSGWHDALADLYRHFDRHLYRHLYRHQRSAPPYSSSIIFRIALLTGAVSLSLKGNSRYL